MEIVVYSITEIHDLESVKEAHPSPSVAIQASPEHVTEMSSVHLAVQDEKVPPVYSR